MQIMFFQAPTIHPINMVTEGSTMTVLCIAMGTPLPTVTLYINGHPLRSEITRHMVTMVHNVTSDMGHVSCYADNGYGTPMIASRKITISSKYFESLFLQYIFTAFHNGVYPGNIYTD